MTEVRWEHLFPDELEARFGACPVLYLPYGMCEPHGPQNTLGLDGLKAHAVCVRAAELGGGIVAPTEWWHVHELGFYAAWAHREIGEVQRKWLTAVPPWVHFKNVCYHIRAADQLGFKAVILLTGHYGPNWMDLKTVATAMQPHVRCRLYGLPDFEAAEPGFAGDGKTKDHAGKVETSLLWALEPDCVDVSRMPPPGTPSATGHHFAMGRDAYEANRLVGERMVGYEANFLVKAAADLVRQYDKAPAETPMRRVRTFGDVEAFWEQHIVPLLPTLASMEGYAAATPEVSAIPAESVWKESSQN